MINFIARCLLLAFQALIFGITVEKISEKLSNKFGWNKFTSLIFQVTLAVSLLYFMENLDQSSGDDAQEWSSTIQGLLFVSLYFGLQKSLYNNSSDLFDYYFR